ncbi:serine hydrolase domain-containing protein [Variovorax sp. M-6]|uniref:serine hydrolase domain-containing protein n=1 Tax=Variovorax sp. M-6 TaxID=3233041 RepID=UPI003F9A4E9D
MTTRHTSLARPAPSSPPLSRRHCLSLAAAGLAAPLLQACGGGSSGTSAFATVVPDPESVRWCRETIQATLRRSDIATTAVSVALLADDRVVWREAFGYADRDNGVLATPDTRFNIASVSKVVAALAVMILRDRGQLALDQPLAELLPAFHMRSEGYTRITVRQLLSHASGVPGNNYRNGINFVPYPDYAQDTLQAVTQSRLKHEPGEMAMYCNDGFTLVEPLVKQLTGLTYPEFVQREIFTPLGMNLSGYALAPAAEGSIVHPYYKGQRMPQELPANYATGGMVSTPTDLLKLARLFLDEGVYEGRRIVSAEAVREMGRDQRARTRIIADPASSLWRWGLGWDTVQQPGLDAAGLRAWNKSGAFEFFGTQFFVLPEIRLAMMITGSGLDYGPLELAEGLLLRSAAERGAIRTMPAAIASVVPAPASPAPDRTALVGVYANYSGPLQVLAAADGSLALRRWSDDGWTVVQERLRARSDGYWWADGQTGICYRFQTLAGHRYLNQRTLSSNQLYWDEEPIGEWLPPVSAPLPDAWKARLGSQWLRVNDLNDSITHLPDRANQTPARWVFDIDQLAEMPGYILSNTAQLVRVIDDNQAGMTVKIPSSAGRDLMELNIVMVNGREELHSGVLVFRRMDA